jgi:hypothetical protein
MRKEKTQINKIRKKKGDKTNAKQIQGIIKDYFGNL